MILLIALAQLYGLAQLALLGWAARVVRLRVLLLAALAGMYAAAPLALLVEAGWTRTIAALSGEPLVEVSSRASSTIDPLIEECAKLAPLLLLWLLVRSLRRQWGTTDVVLAGAALGTGFGLAEQLLRFSAHSGQAIHLATGGWAIPAGQSTATVPGIARTLGSWLPAGVWHSSLPDAGTGALNLQLVWSSVAALGLALTLRRGAAARTRLAGVALIVLAVADHAAANTQGVAGSLARALASPFTTARPIAWAYPLAALTAAMWLDRRQRPAYRAAPPPEPQAALAAAATAPSGRDATGGMAAARGRGRGAVAAGLPDRFAGTAEPPAGAGVVLACERRGRIRSLGLVRLALSHPPWSLLAVWGFVRLRRGWRRSARWGEPDLALGEALAMIGPALDRAGGWKGSRVWHVAARRRSRRRAAARAQLPAAGELPTTGHGLLALAWFLLLLPPALYLLIGGVPSLAGIQRAMESAPLSWAVVATSVAGAAWTAWNLAVGARRLPDARRHPAAEVPAGATLLLLIRAGALLVPLIAFWLLAGGHAPGDQLLASAHVLDAAGQASLLLVMVLALAAIATAPPFALAPAAGGEPVIGRLVVAAVVGGIGAALLEGGDESGGDGSGGSKRADGQEPVPGLPYTAGELAQLADRHAGAGARPAREEIERVIASAEPRPVRGQNAVRFDDRGVSVIVNRDLPWRSTAYFAGR